VIEKQIVSPTGDKHDYMSQTPHWWPNRKTANGLPYIRRDGEPNPEICKISDHDQMGRMSPTVRTGPGLVLYGQPTMCGTGDPAVTHVIPRAGHSHESEPLNFAQGIPGINYGRKS